MMFTRGETDMGERQCFQCCQLRSPSSRRTVQGRIQKRVTMVSGLHSNLAKRNMDPMQTSCAYRPRIKGLIWAWGG